MEYGEQVFCEFLFGTVNRRAKNHDFSTVLLDQELYDFAAEAGESIPMGNNNSELITSQDAFQ